MSSYQHGSFARRPDRPPKEPSDEVGKLPGSFTIKDAATAPQAEPPKRLPPFRWVGSGDIDARDVKAQEAAEGCAEYERPQQYRQYR